MKNKWLDKLVIFPLLLDVLVQYYRSDIKLALPFLSETQVTLLIIIIHLALQGLVVFLWKKNTSYVYGYAALYIGVSIFFLGLMFLSNVFGVLSARFACEQLFYQFTHYPLLLVLFYFSGGLPLFEKQIADNNEQ